MRALYTPLKGISRALYNPLKGMSRALYTPLKGISRALIPSFPYEEPGIHQHLKVSLYSTAPANCLNSTGARQVGVDEN